MKKPQPGDLVRIRTGPMDQVYGRYEPDFVVRHGDDVRVRSKFQIPHESFGLCLSTKFVWTTFVWTTSCDATFYLFLMDDRVLWLCDKEAEFDVID